eukprot:TRINITY_DN5071_c0_g1_i6.p1 TRINITY_DN5071_c0_g1~~TRINITY_DN5071_c0_g1_i6.p1  ORF type:complete len:120 (-),score=13.78 TRINITY_DN5071_c0_g1_i6:11-370(-)
MNKKKSKKCCIFHRSRSFDESSTESDRDSNAPSSDDSDDSDDEKQPKKPKSSKTTDDTNSSRSRRARRNRARILGENAKHKGHKCECHDSPADSENELEEIGRAVQQECRDRSRMPSSA